MIRKSLLASVGVMALLIVVSLSGGQTGVQADTSSMDWDMSMTDAAPTGSDPVCASDSDDNIDTGECPEMASHLFIDTRDATSNESFFDLATQMWRTGPPGADLDSDTLPEPSDGIVQYSGLAHGTTLGQITFSIKNNLNPALLPSNIDTTTGQPPLCGTAGTGTFAPAPFYIWKATTNSAQTVSYLDEDNDGKPETQENNFTVGACGTPPPDGNKIPDGVDCTPTPIPDIQATIGLPQDNYIGRSYGIANLPIFPPLVYNPVDVNFLVYNMVNVAEVQGYVQFTVVQYPGTPVADPRESSNVTTQTVDTCPPYSSSPVRVYGITQDSDFDIPPDGTIDLTTPREKHREVIGAGGPYDSLIYKSVGEDWDGDTISDHYDRCSWDPNSGSAADDTDKDYLTGLCDEPGVGNGEGTGCQTGDAKTVLDWHVCQDIDQDGFLNSADNCSVVADGDVDGDTDIDRQLDSDGDGIGDVCEMSAILGLPPNARLIRGDGHGYPGKTVANLVGTSVIPQVQGKAPGMFVDRDNVCTDPFTIGALEPTLDDGRICLGPDQVGRPYGPTASGISALVRVVVDSNDDADPDLLDWPVSGRTGAEWLDIEWMDTNSDSDIDGHTDACEAFMGSDTLDAASVPGGPPPAGDCDGDTVSDAAEEAAGTSPFSGLDPDADGDGCKRSQEHPGGGALTPGATAAGGVSFQDNAWYDYYDVPAPANNDPTPNGPRNKAVNVQDVVAVLKYVGTSLNGPSNGKVDYDSDKDGDTVRDGLDYDRSPGPAPNPPKDAGAPNGVVNVQDVVAVLGQAGRSCV